MLAWIFIVALAGLNVFCWRKYMKYKTALAAYIRYLNEQGVKEPTSETVREYQKWAVEKMVNDFFHLR